MSDGQVRIPATLIPGDGIGPEIVDAVVAILDAIGSPFEWDRQWRVCGNKPRGRSVTQGNAGQYPKDTA